MENRFCFCSQCAVAAGQFCIKLRIAMNAIIFIASLLQLTSLTYACTNLGRRLPCCTIVDLLDRHRINLDLNVNAVQQRAGNTIEITADLMLGTAALLLLTPEEAAGTRVHTCYKHETGLILSLILYAGDGDDAILQRLTKSLQCVTAEFRQFIHEKDAIVGHADFTRTGIRSATNQTGHRCAMMRRTEGTCSHQTTSWRQFASDGMNSGCLKRFIESQRRQDPRQAASQHRFAGTRNADHEHVMAACSSYFQCAPCAKLPLNRCHIHHVLCRGNDLLITALTLGWNAFLPFQMHGNLMQMLRRIHANPLDTGDFFCVSLGKNNVHDSLLTGTNDHGQCAANRLQSTVQRQLAQHQRAGQIHLLQLV